MEKRFSLSRFSVRKEEKNLGTNALAYYKTLYISKKLFCHSLIKEEKAFHGKTL